MVLHHGPKGSVKAQRVTRCLRIVNQLQSGVRRTVGDLAAELGVSRRTVFRDLHLVQDAGLGMQFHDREKRYIVHAPLNVKSAVMTKDDWTMLLLAAHVLGQSMDRQNRDSLARIIAKILTQFPAAVSDDIARMINAVSADASGIRVSNKTSPDPVRVFVVPDGRAKGVILEPTTTSWPGTDCSQLEKILLGLREKRYLRICYRLAGTGKPPERTKVTPARLLRVGGQWSLIGRSTFHRAKMSFPLLGIQDVEVLDEKFL